MTEQTYELALKDEGFRELVEAWPRLSERARWDIFIMVWWHVFKKEVAQVFESLAALVCVAVDTLKRM